LSHPQVEHKLELRRRDIFTKDVGVLSLVPGTKISVVGPLRDREMLGSDCYLKKLNGPLKNRTALILAPLLATGGGLVASIGSCKQVGCKPSKD